MPSGGQRDGEDLALLWCLEKLLSSSKVNSNSLMTFMANLSWNSLLCGNFPYSFKCRIFLHRLKRQESLTFETVEALETLASLARSWARDDLDGTPQSDIVSLMPEPLLVMDVKTAIVMQLWAGTPGDTVVGRRRRVLEVFGSQVLPVEQSRYDDCLQAAKDAHRRNEIMKRISVPDILQRVDSYVNSCLHVLGVPVIDAVLEDASSGAYNNLHSSSSRRVSNLSRMKTAEDISHRQHDNMDMVNNNDHGRLMDVIGMANGIISRARDDPSSVHDGSSVLDILGTAKEFLGNPGTSNASEQQSVENVLLMLQKGFSTPTEEDHETKGDLPTSSKDSKQRGNTTGVKRRPNRWWSQEEVAVLKAGLFKYGPGSWAKILREHGDILVNRTQVDLKDKWRNMKRNKEDADVEAILGMARNSMKQ